MPQNIKRTLFCGFDTDQELEALTAWIGTQPPTTTGLISPLLPDLKSKTIHLSFQDLEQMGEFHQQNTQEMPSRILLESLHSAESIALKMLGRADPGRLKSQQYEFRKTRYYALLAFFLGFLKDYDFQRVVFSKPPERADLFILLKLAETQGLETKIFHRLPFEGALLISKSLHFPELSQQSGTLPETITQELTKEEPNHLRDLIKIKPSKVSYPWTSRISNALARKKIKVTTTLPSNFIYFPLDESAESSSAPFAESFTEPYLAILTIARALPSGITLIIQEQKTPNEIERSPEFYEILAAEPKIAFVKPTHDRLDLLKQSKAVATISGKIGWSGAILGKPCILLGSTFYQEMIGVHRYRNPADLRNFLKNPAQPADLHGFMAKLTPHIHTSTTAALATL